MFIFGSTRPLKFFSSPSAFLEIVSNSKPNVTRKNRVHIMLEPTSGHSTGIATASGTATTNHSGTSIDTAAGVSSSKKPSFFGSNNGSNLRRRTRRYRRHQRHQR